MEDFSRPIPSVFVATPGALTPTGGGVQICTHEYVRGLELAGFGLSPISYSPDRRLRKRLANRLLPTVYPVLWKPSFIPELLKFIEQERAEFVFLNLVSFGRLIQPLRAALSNRVKLVVLSHGLESVDYVHALRIQARWGRTGPKSLWSGPRKLSRQLIEEMRQREFIDQVICLAPFEAEIERWLGARAVGWLPRTVPRDAGLLWKPIPNRFGFVGTLDHPPNYEAVQVVCSEFARCQIDGFEMRLVGGPARIGQSLTSRYPFVTYLGSLSDSELESEAASWTGFLHPLFCYARGCSTKLAIGLKWQLPIITTPEGCRGYVWESGELPMARSASEFVNLVRRLADLTIAAKVREQVIQVAKSGPTMEQVGGALRRMLLNPGNPPAWRADRSELHSQSP